MHENEFPEPTTMGQVIRTLLFFIALFTGLYFLTIYQPEKPSPGHMAIQMIGNTFDGPEYYIEKNRINIMAFGAVGDGKTYDDEAYKAALKEVERRGLPLYFPTAHYRFHQLYFPDCAGALLEFESSLVELDSYHVIIRPEQPIRNLKINGMQLRPTVKPGKNL